jgi:hypothetical protein
MQRAAQDHCRHVEPSPLWVRRDAASVRLSAQAERRAMTIPFPSVYSLEVIAGLSLSIRRHDNQGDR